MEDRNLLKGNWLLQEDMHEFKQIKDFEKTLKISVRINGVETKRVKFSLSNSASEEEVVGDEEYEDAKATWDDDEVKDPRGLEQGEQYPPLEIVEPHEKRTTREHQIVSFKNKQPSDEGEPRDWIKEIQDEINSLKLKGIDVDEVFSMLVKIMKKALCWIDRHGSELKSWIEDLLPQQVRGGDCCGSSPILWQESHVVKNSYQKQETS